MAKHLLGMHQRGRLAAYRGDFMGDDPVTYIEVKNDERLPVGHSDIQRIQIGGDGAGSLNRFGHHFVPTCLTLSSTTSIFMRNPFF